MIDVLLFPFYKNYIGNGRINRNNIIFIFME